MFNMLYVLLKMLRKICTQVKIFVIAIVINLHSNQCTKRGGEKVGCSFSLLDYKSMETQPKNAEQPRS